MWALVHSFCLLKYSYLHLKAPGLIYRLFRKWVFWLSIAIFCLPFGQACCFLVFGAWMVPGALWSLYMLYQFSSLFFPLSALSQREEVHAQFLHGIAHTRGSGWDRECAMSEAFEKSVLHRLHKNYSLAYPLNADQRLLNAELIWPLKPPWISASWGQASVIPAVLLSRLLMSSQPSPRCRPPMLLLASFPDLSGGPLRALFHCESVLPHPSLLTGWKHSLLSILWPPAASPLLLPQHHLSALLQKLSLLGFKPFMQVPS